MKKGAKLNTAFKGFGRLSPNSKQKQHERALVASRTKQVPHYAKRGAPPVIGHAQPAAAAEAEAEEGGPPRASEPEPPAENRAGGRRVRQRTSDLASEVSGINWGRRA